MNGGTDLYVQRPEDMTHAPATYVFDDPAFKEIKIENGRIEIGGSVTVTRLLESDVMRTCFPKLYPHMKLVSSTPIRNMATVAGNLINASPIGDLTIWFLAMNATIVLRNGHTREIPLRDFYYGYKTMEKTADEVVEKIYFPKPDQHTWFNFEKVSKRRYLDIASVNSAISLTVKDHKITDAHVSIGGVSPIPLYLKNTSSCLLQKHLPLTEMDRKELQHVLQAEIHPITDVRGSAAYKRTLAHQLFTAHLMEFDGRDH
jgi:xanthine dehydrogenase small subunit